MQGNLRDLSLSEVIDALSLRSGFQGRIVLARDSDAAEPIGSVWLADEAIVGAEAPPDHGIDALLRLLAVREGTFETEIVPVPPEVHNIAHLTIPAFLSYVRRLPDLWTALRRQVPSPFSVPVPASALPTVTLTLTPDHFRVLFAVDGYRSVAAIAALTGLDDLTVTQVVAELVERGVIVLQQPDAARRAGDHLDDVVLRAVPPGRWQRPRPFAPESAPATVLAAIREETSLAEVQKITGLPISTLLAAVKTLRAHRCLEVVRGEALLDEVPT